MFFNAITGLQVTDPVAARVIPGVIVNGNGPDGDQSLAATTRILLGKRLKEDEKFYVYSYLMENMEGIDDMEGKTLDDLVRAEPNSLTVLYTDSDKYMSSTTDSAVRQGLQELPKCNLYTEAYKYAAKFFIDEENHRTYVLLPTTSNRCYHLIQGLFSLMAPQYFPNRRADMTDEEFDLLNSTNEIDSDLYVSLISKMQKEYDFNRERVMSLLDGFKKKVAQREIDRARRDFENLLQEALTYEAEYAKRMERAHQVNMKLLGAEKLLQDAQEKSSELAEFFLANKCLNLRNVEGEVLDIYVNTYLNQWNPDEYDSMINNTRSHLYTSVSVVSNSPFREKKNVRKVLDAIFGENAQFKVRSLARYIIDIGRSSVRSECRGASVPEEYRPAIYNPHLYFHNCLGGNGPIMNQYLRDGDIEGCLAQCIASAQSINISETVTAGEFVRYLFETQPVCLELPNGKVVNANEALTWLNEKEKENAAD